MRVTLRVFGRELLDLEATRDTEPDEEPPTFGFASQTGYHELSDDRALDTSDRSGTERTATV